MALDHIKALLVRLALCLHFTLVVWRVVVTWASERYWYMSAAIIPFALEGLYTVFKRRGVEWKLFSLCFFFYLGATLPGIWLLEIKRTQTFQSQNQTSLDAISISGLEIPVRLNSDTWVLVLEEMMLYLMIVGRWFLPRGKIGREQLTQLLFSLIGIASDIMELFSLFDEDTQIRHDTTLTYVILGVWSLSVLQFTLTFATTHRPRRERGLRLSPEDPHEEDARFRRSVLRVELLATVLSLMMQDGPFFCVRLYTMITYSVITYSLVFFTAKNVLVILLLVYKIFLLLGKLCCPLSHHHHHEASDEEEGKYYEEEDSIDRKLSQDFFCYGVNGSMELSVPKARRSRQAYLNEGFVLDQEPGDAGLRRGMEGLAATPDASRPLAFGQSHTGLMPHNGMISGGAGVVPNGGIASSSLPNLSMGGKASKPTAAPHNPQGKRTVLITTHQSRTLPHSTRKKIIRLSKKSKTLTQQHSLKVTARGLINASKTARGNTNVNGATNDSRPPSQKLQSNGNFSTYTPRILQPSSQQNSSSAAKAFPQNMPGHQNSNNVTFPSKIPAQNAPRSADSNVTTKTLPQSAPGHAKSNLTAVTLPRSAPRNVNPSISTATLPHVAHGHVNSSMSATTLPQNAPRHVDSSISTTTLPHSAPGHVNSSIAAATLQTMPLNAKGKVSPVALTASTEITNPQKMLQETPLETKRLSDEAQGQHTLQTNVQGGTTVNNTSRSLQESPKVDTNAFHLTETPQQARDNISDVIAARQSTGSTPQPTLGPKVTTAPSDSGRDGANPTGSRPKGDKGKNKRKKDSTSAHTAASTQPLVSPGGKPSGQAQLPDLMSVIDGPATPARPMERTKKYDKLLVTSETKAIKGNIVKRSEDGKKKPKRPSENGMPLADLDTKSEKPEPDPESGVVVVSGVDDGTTGKVKPGCESSLSVTSTDVACEESTLTSDAAVAASNTNATSETAKHTSDKVATTDTVLDAKFRALNQTFASDDSDREANGAPPRRVAADFPAGDEVQKIPAHLNGLCDVSDLSDELPPGQQPQRQNEQRPVPKNTQTRPHSSQSIPEPESFLNPLSLAFADPSPGLSTTTLTEGRYQSPAVQSLGAGRP